MKKNILFIVLFVLLGVGGFAQNGEYVDLGLPSGTKWKTVNEKGHYVYDHAVARFGKELPRIEQWEELKEKCKWLWVDGHGDIQSGYNVVGPNGKSIFLPAAGSCIGSDLDEVGRFGYYWSRTYRNEDYAYQAGFSSGDVSVFAGRRFWACSVRLVKD